MPELRSSVTLVRASSLTLRCESCQHIWSPTCEPNQRLPALFWLCPNGCNPAPGRYPCFFQTPGNQNWIHRTKIKRDDKMNNVSAQKIFEVLGGHQNGDGFMVHCPAHDDSTPSLSVKDQNGNVLVYCFANCSQENVMEALAAKGLWTTLRKKQTKNNILLKILKGSVSLSDERASIGRAYLQSRGLLLDQLKFYSASLRFHPSVGFYGKDKKLVGNFPALITVVSDGNSVTSIQRIYLTDQGMKADVPEPKKNSWSTCRWLLSAWSSPPTNF